MTLSNDVCLLDTDTISNYLDRRRGNLRLRKRIERESPDAVFISIITFEEIMRGVLNLLTQARKHPRNGGKVVAYYGLLQNLLHDLRRFQILPYDADAETKYQQIPANIRQRHSQDCQIAAVALAHNITLITRNTRHFAGIPDLSFED